jgi:2-polyprenyl-6-hydroxyphenyl methylase/3-demethylubiquinone-9 3-methyltransferase
MTDLLRQAQVRASRAELHGPRDIHDHLTRPIVQRLNLAGARQVLDLGCGDGWFTGALDRCGFDVCGIDADTERLAAARHRYPHLSFLQRDATQAIEIEPPTQFDAVVAVDVVDHVAQPRRLVGAALDVLRPGGMLVVTSPYYGYAKNLALALAGRFDRRWDPLLDDGRLKFFSRATLTALLASFALSDLRFQTIGRVPLFARAMILSAVKAG